MPQALDGSTICAISTAPSVGGIAVVRVSGPEALRISSAVFSKTLSAENDRSVVFGRIVDGDTIIDEGLALVLYGPGSYTGEDTVEFNVHGSRFIQSEVVRLLILSGCRLAGPGEFTQRAFLNGKLDLTQAEAVADLIAAEHSGAHRLAVEQLRGNFSREVGELRESLIEFAGLLELELDFSEEDVEFADRTRFLELIDKLLERVSSLADSFRSGNAIKSGVPVAILGAPNAGKSTLLNALVGDERAIVSDIAGTTRDVIEDTCVIEGTLFRFIDTAGIRETSDVIENEGIKRAIDKASKAHTILYMLDASEENLSSAEAQISSLDIPGETDVIAVWNKCDVKSAPTGKISNCKASIDISASSGEGIEKIKSILIESHSVSDSASSLVVTNARHFEALVNARESLESVKISLEGDTPSDLVAIDVRQTLHHLGSITGAVHADDILGHIFSHFCIGK
ncbi:MAG: tRNA uridine-5-carboxymethylaminomethyl(34) synthesis GTPase MnmE [Euryarchaeota archaeon]|nr:tRNA uridine-5-carboxymethylaminomethyl(34) synthesis GTPase MnmE [Euryarchaeota archaeon]|tara:strand:- start:1437 stop:2804 length:1368 start_codon:yes stop_codon:yes gene_type:complete